MPAILLSADLMTSSRVSGAAARQNIVLHTAIGLQELLEQQQALSVGLVLFDLSLTGVDPHEMVKKLRELSNNPLRIVAFGPHVHAARLTAARAAGCDEVLSRGEFYGHMDEVLTDTASGDAS